MQLAMMSSKSNSFTQLRAAKGKGRDFILADDGVLPVGDYGGEDLSDDDR